MQTQKYAMIAGAVLAGTPWMAPVAHATPAADASEQMIASSASQSSTRSIKLTSIAAPARDHSGRLAAAALSISIAG